MPTSPCARIRRCEMPTLVAIGSPEVFSAATRCTEVLRLASGLGLEADSVAVVRRDRVGRFYVTTYHHAVEGESSWGMFWALLFGLLFFIPMLGMPTGPGLRELMDKVDRAGFDDNFRDEVTDMLQPGTSALFLLVGDPVPQHALSALSHFGGAVVTTSLSIEAESELQYQLHGPA